MSMLQVSSMAQPVSLLFHRELQLPLPSTAGRHLVLGAWLLSHPESETCDELFIASGLFEENHLDSIMVAKQPVGWWTVRYIFMFSYFAPPQPCYTK